MKHLSYKGYKGTIEYSPEDKVLYGKVIGIKSLISYEGDTGESLEKDFRSAVDEYIEHCNILDIDPEKPFKGSFNVRISPELHTEAALIALEKETSLNNLVAEAIRDKVDAFKKKQESFRINK